ncbi:XRE family transcriptional regulator [Chitinophaga silvatica]|uniref:XRE family transcriptional regulator n=1 Tax=Chitinophaga silvatica TaxID=2282649 RepID=A0A3E1YHG0_9BACT|nr:helix-turn-helix transcriptional regulator [Chitinophaga silvatica]RFS26806.1 XRE family transcriptional regulator [Chitinophaga silvatica]
MNLGMTILQLREKMGLKQGQLAENLDITQTYLSQIENNKKLPNIALLERISSELSTPLPFIFFLSLDEKDIPAERVPHFKLLEPLLKKFVHELID